MTLITASPLIAILLILALLIGYFVGKSTGEHQGYLRGLTHARYDRLMRVIQVARDTFRAGREFERRFPSNERVAVHERN